MNAPRILVIEDNPENMELMTYLMHAAGYATIAARDGAEGLAAARREAPELIICDIHLPHMDGYEVLRQLKLDPKLREVPALAVTALAMVGDREKLLAAGFDGYIKKPLEPRTFIDSLQGFLAAPRPTPVLTSETFSVMPVSAERPPARAYILVVDDTRANRDLVCAVLEPFGYQITVVGSMHDALVELHSGKVRYRLIISDVHMPTEDGFQLIQAVKSDPALQRIPFIFLSSSVWGAERDCRRALELHAAEFIARPIEPRRLLQRVEACLALPI